MSTTINILTQAPTFDLTEWEITNYDYEDRIFFCQSKQVFKFDKCKGTIMPRSRILRYECKESQYIENIISATIDSGFCGKLMWKVKLTEFGKERFEFADAKYNYSLEVFPYFQKLIQNSVQIDLNPFPRNYYQGTNQTDLEPDVVFCGEDERFTKINNILQELQKIISQLQSSMKRAFSLVNVHWKK